MIDKNHNTLTLSFDPNIGSVYADGTKLRQSILNILDNASKFTENGYIIFKIESEARNDEDWVSFSVSDTGIGISEEQVSKLFSEFTQVDSSTTKAAEGTGLGLALSKRFCEIMGGHIVFHSELGRGSTFTIRIPRKVVKNTSINYENDKLAEEIYKRA